MKSLMDITHAYTPEQYAKVVELWERLLDCHFVNKYEEIGHSSCYVENLREGQLYELVISDGEKTENHYAIRLDLISYSDYGGSIYDAANVRALLEIEGISGTADTSSGEAWVQLGELPWGDGDREEGISQLTHLVETVEALAGDCVVLDDSAYDEYREELISQSWSADWGTLRKIRDELNDISGNNGDDFGFSDDELGDLYFEYEWNEWVDESATSVVNQCHEDAVAHVLKSIERSWLLRLDDPNQISLFKLA